MRRSLSLRPLLVVAVSMGLTSSLCAASADATDSVATRQGVHAAARSVDPNAVLPNKLVKAVNAQHRHRARMFATATVADEMLNLTGHGATFSRMKGCDKTGPLRTGSERRVSTVTCSSKITNAEGASGGYAFLSYKEKDQAKVFRITYSN